MTKSIAHRLASVAALVASAVLLSCGTDDNSMAPAERSAEPPTTAAASDGEPAPDVLDPLRKLSQQVLAAQVTCREPELNVSPDASNRYTASMVCIATGDLGVADPLEIGVRYKDELAEAFGEPCTTEDNPFDDTEQTWSAFLMSGDFFVIAESVDHGIVADGTYIVQSLTDFARSASLDERVTCDAF